MNKLMNVLLGISGALILAGIIFRLQHWPYGNMILWIGFIANIVLSNFEISRLKKIIKALSK